VRFLVDAQLPPALARRLDALGHPAQHVIDCGLATAPDHRIREYAAHLEAVIVTKDEDFAVWQLLRPGPPVVWLRLGNTRRATILARVEAELTAIVRAIDAGERLVEVR
jgi:predicted nuclease of predicted toxin-antitoxin system